MSYVIHPDVKHYFCYVLDGTETRNKLGRDTMFHFDQSPKSYADIWQPIEITFAKLSGNKKGNMPDLMIRNGRLFLNKKAYECLHQHLEGRGEFLPVTYGEESGYLFNILALADNVDGLDKKLSTKNEFYELQSLAFHEDRIKGFSVFRTAFDNFMGVYCNENFKLTIESAGLNGVSFSPDLGNIFPPDSTAQEPTKH